MTHRCETCGQEFNTLTKKRLHDCEGAPAEMHDMPDTLTDGLPERFLTMDEAAALDESGVRRFFPLLSIGGFNASGQVIAGYAKTENGHSLLAFNGEDKTWYIVEKNRDAASFERDEDDLLMYVCKRSDVDPADVYGYDSSDPDYPQLGE
jgi:hypothetical protein